MRNLKKFLALVLAMMMTLSLMVSVNAKDITADFTDAESVTEEFQEAVDVLNGMKVFEGYTDGSFQPKGEITRAEVATIVYRLATGDWEGVQAHLYKDYEKFTDVNGDHWAAGYINYCANAEWIAGYGNGKFGPSDKVTGYQAAAMILRAVGYGKNNEFVGPTWQVQVANVTRSEGLLTNVDNTNYANTLNRPATRELVAEILFQAAQIPTVTWTMLGGYNKYTDVLGYNQTMNDSLGYANYGLTAVYGIVVDNQETSLNRNHTKLSVAVDSANRYYTNSTALGYVYSRTGTTNTNRIIRLDLATGLNEFGHAYKVWFNSWGRWDNNETTSNRTVYAAYDKSTKSQLVFDNSTEDTDGTVASLDTSALAAGQSNLGSIATGVGFKLNTNGAFRSNGYADFSTRGGAPARSNNVYESPQHMYALISNSSDNTLDVVVALNVEATKITAINSNVATASKTISTAWYSEVLNRGLNGYAGIEGADFMSTHQTGAVNDVVVSNTSGTSGDPATMTILQSKLTANSSTTFQDYVIGNALYSTSNKAMTGNIAGEGTNNIIAYNTKAAMDTKQGTVVSYHVNPSWNNADPDYVMLSDGTKIEKSVLYLTAASKTGTSGTIIPQVGNGVNANEVYNYSEYEFILDGDGKYIGARPITKTDFVYGTYVDYTQELSTSTFKYYLTGVDKDGKVVTKEVSKHNGADINSVQLEDRYHPTSSHPSGFANVPFRDTTATATNGIGDGVYHPYTVNDGNARFTGFMSGTANSGVLYDFFTTKTTIDRESTTLGAEALGNYATYQPDGASTASNLYFTDNTKFVLVEGFGTDSLKTQVYNGITELLGNNRQVVFNIDSTNCGTSTTDHFSNNVAWARMTYMEKEKFIYNQTVGVTAEQATLVILPKAAVTFVGSSNLYYVGDPTATSHNEGNEAATRFTMYDAEGNKADMWIKGDSRTAGNNAYYVAVTGGADKFYDLVDSGKKAVDGQTIWEIQGNAAHADIVDVNAATARPTTMTITRATKYEAQTFATQNAAIDLVTTTYIGGGTVDPSAQLYRVEGAKVVNLSGTGAGLGNRYPGITDLTSLNNSSYTQSGNTIRVSCVMDPDNNMIVKTIFVCYNQNA